VCVWNEKYESDQGGGEQRGEGAEVGVGADSNDINTVFKLH